MYWIIQDGLDRESGFSELREALSRGKISHSFHKVVPFVGELVPDIELDEPVMMIGSYSMRHVAKRKGWSPGVFDLAGC